MNRTLKTLRHIMHYGRMRLPLAKRIRDKRDPFRNRYYMLHSYWKTVIEGYEETLEELTRRLESMDKWTELYYDSEIPSNLPKPPKRPETPRSDLYDAPNLPKIKTSEPPERKNEHSNLAKIANGATAFEIYRRKLLRAQQNNRA